MISSSSLEKVQARLEGLIKVLRRAASKESGSPPPSALLAGALLRMADWGPAEKALREALNARTGAVQDGLALSRDLIGRGDFRAAGREIVRLLRSPGDAPPASLLGAVQAQLKRLGWDLSCGDAEVGPDFFVSDPGGPRGDLVLDAPQGSGGAGGGSVLPAFRLSPRPRPGCSREERRGISELAAGLGLLLESLRGREGREAPARAESHEEVQGDRRLLRLTFACNQRCQFCFIPVARGRAEPGRIEREIDALAREFPSGGTLTISGGEPTVEPRLPEILARARRRGIRRFVLQTNAVALARPGLAEKLVGLGVRACLVSFHSHRPEIYDRLTGSRGQYPRAVKGVSRLLACRGCGVTFNVVVTALNYRDLPGLIGFLGRLSAGGRRRRPGVFFSMMNGAGHHKAPSLAVSLKEIAPFLRKAVERCREEGLTVEKFGGESSFPVCLLKQPGKHVSRRSFSQDRMRYAEEFSGELGGVGRAKLPACRSCAYNERCLGVPAEYARMFGLGDLPRADS